MHKDKELGFLLGLHAGDSLGSTLEFSLPNPPGQWQRDIIGGGTLGWKAGDATDDTDLMLAVLKSITTRQEFNIMQCKNLMINWYLQNPKDIGITTRTSITHLEAGLPPPRASQISESNGSLMRCSPLALMNTSYSELVYTIQTQAALTHGAKIVWLCDELLIQSLQMLVKGCSKSELKASALEWSATNFPVFHKILNIVSTIEWKDLPTSGHCIETLLAAFWALEHSSSFEEALIKIVNRGNDSDTTGAVAGALCGSYYGASQIPKRWLDTLQYQKEIKKEYNRIAK